MFGRPSRMSGRPSRMSMSGREALPNVREWSRGPTGCAGVVGRLSRMSRSDQETLPDILKWSRDPLGYPAGPPG